MQDVAPPTSSNLFAHCTATAPPLQELARQYGDDDEKGITLVPTVRIDGKEYRGKLDAPGARIARSC